MHVILILMVMMDARGYSLFAAAMVLREQLLVRKSTLQRKERERRGEEEKKRRELASTSQLQFFLSTSRCVLTVYLVYNDVKNE